MGITSKQPCLPSIIASHSYYRRRMRHDINTSTKLVGHQPLNKTPAISHPKNTNTFCKVSQLQQSQFARSSLIGKPSSWLTYSATWNQLRRLEKESFPEDYYYHLLLLFQPMWAWENIITQWQKCCEGDVNVMFSKQIVNFLNSVIENAYCQQWRWKNMAATTTIHIYLVQLKHSGQQLHHLVYIGNCPHPVTFTVLKKRLHSRNSPLN